MFARISRILKFANVPGVLLLVVFSVVPVWVTIVVMLWLFSGNFLSTPKKNS